MLDSQLAKDDCCFPQHWEVCGFSTVSENRAQELPTFWAKCKKSKPIKDI